MPDQIIVLESLTQGSPGITPSFGATLVEACLVCLASSNHQPNISLVVEGSFTTAFALSWSWEVTDQMLRTWNDETETTEQAAYAIAILLARLLLNLTVIERSRKGTGFDYWLGEEVSPDSGIFQRKTRLEVSGIRHGAARDIATRLSTKLKQVRRVSEASPVYVIVVEFSVPIARVEKA